MQNAAPRFRYSRMSLLYKIGAGYMVMAVFTTAALAFAFLNVYASYKDAKGIAGKDLPVVSALIRLHGSLLAQESYARKYEILKDQSFVDLFKERQRESLADLSILRRSGAATDTGPVTASYQEYQKAAEELFTGRTSDTTLLQSSAVRALDAVDELYARRQEVLQEKLKEAAEKQKSAITWTIVLSTVGFLIAIWVAPFVTYRTFRAIRELQKATHRISAGEFDRVPDIPGEDEISQLAGDFSRMAERLKVLEQMNLDASPLTRLPGNIVIERVLDERLKAGVPFAFCYADLDNFKPFSDHYGYAKGSDLLRVTGDIISAVVSRVAGPEGFVGHVGGDDFVMVVPTDKAEEVCQEVIRGFDVEVLRHYAHDERAAGGIEGTDRYGVRRFFPVTTISIAVILCGGGRYGSAVDIARAAAEVKDTAKETPGSSYVISRQECV